MKEHCPECGEEMELVDITCLSAGWCSVHTGDIYFCETCEIKWLYDFISGKVRRWLG